MNKQKLPDGWKEVELGGVGQIVTGCTPPKKNPEYYGDSFPWIKPPDLDNGMYVSESKEKISEIGRSKVRILPEGSVIVSCIGIVGKVAIAKCEMCTNQQINSIIPNQDIANSKFLYYLITKIKPVLEKRASSSVVPLLNKSEFSKFKINLPPLPTQQKIVSILERAEKAKEWRKEADALTNDFLKSVFLEMFGDPMNNEKGWQVKRLEELSIKIQIGPFGTQLHEKDYIENGIPLINPKHINDGRIEIDLKQTIAKEKYETLSNYHLKKGDVIMGRRGEMGRCALITSKEDGWLCGTGSLFIRPNETLNLYYLIFVLRSSSFVRKLENDALGVTMMNLNMTTVNNLIIPFPPIPLQEKFASIVEQLESMKEHQKQSKQHIDNLFNVLMQKAFKGELVV